MGNSAVTVKLTANKYPCEITDLQLWEDVTEMYNVDKYGEPEYRVDKTAGYFRCYYCVNCQEEFDDINKAKEHLDE